jgi:hypothetical protein
VTHDEYPLRTPAATAAFVTPSMLASGKGNLAASEVSPILASLISVDLGLNPGYGLPVFNFNEHHQAYPEASEQLISQDGPPGSFADLGLSLYPMKGELI